MSQKNDLNSPASPCHCTALRKASGPNAMNAVTILPRQANQKNPFPQADLLDPIEDVLEALHHDQPVIVTDDAQRENEGDLILAAEKSHR